MGEPGPGIASAVLVALDAALRRHGVATARRYLAEVAGLVPGPVARELLERLATDASEALGRASRGHRLTGRPRRRAAAGRRHVRWPRRVAASARPCDRRGRCRCCGAAARAAATPGEDGLKIAQVHLAAVLDAEATRAGMGDAGGVATLLPRLGAALAAQPRIHEIISIGRALPGVPAATRLREQPAMGGHRFENVPLEEGEGATFAGAWPSLVAAERGIRAALLASGTPDVIHLRMADPGSLAAARVARELGIPTVFTLAPDPHGPIAAAERRGTLDRRDASGRRTRGRRSGTASDLVAQLARRGPRAGPLPATRPAATARRPGGHRPGCRSATPHHRGRGRGYPAGRRCCGGTCGRHERGRPGRPGARHRAPARGPAGAAHRRQRRSAPRGQGHGPHRRGLRPRPIARRGGPTSSSSAATSTIRLPARRPSWRASTSSSDGTPASRDRVVLLGHRRHAEAGLRPRGREARLGRAGRARWRLRLWQPQGGVRARHPGGHGGRPARRRAAVRRPCHLRRAWRHRRARGHDRPARHRGRHPTRRCASPAIRRLASAPAPSWTRASRSSRMARTLAAVYRIAAGASTLALTVEEGRAA